MYCTTFEDSIATSSSNCDRVIADYNQFSPLLTDARIYEQHLAGHRFFVELVSQSLEPQDGYPVPKATEIVDAVVIQPTEQAIASLVSACGWLKDYTIVRYWQPESNEF